jgi:PAS domain S-box-containing protein
MSPLTFRHHLKSPLARKQLVYILVFSSVITLAGTSLQIYFEFREDMTLLDHQFVQIEKAHLASLTNSLWRLDDAQIDIQLNNMLSLRDMVRLEIRDNDRLLYSAGVKAHSGQVVVRVIEMVHHVGDRTEKIGSLQAFATMDGIYDRLRNRIALILTTQAIKTFLVSFFILFVVHHLVTRHLARLAACLGEFDPQAENSQPGCLALPPGKPDELHAVITAVNSMQQRLYEDFQERRRATAALADNERRLRQSTNLLQTILSNLDEAVMLVDPRTRRIVECNTTTEQIFGYPREQIIGRDTSLFHVNQTMFEEFGEMSCFAKNKHGFFRTEYKMKRHNAEIFPTEHYVTDIAGQKNEPGLAVSIVRDITTRKLWDQHLQQIQKAEAIGRLSGGIAHDFNNILGIILGNVEMVLIHKSSEQADYGRLEEIRAACLRAKKIIRQLLSLTQPSKEDFFPVALGALLEEAIRLLRASMASNIHIHQQIDPHLDLVMANPTQIHQILLNLCTNAIHAMEDGGGQLSIRLFNLRLSEMQVGGRVGLHAGDYVLLEVSDTGEGIAAEHIDKVFDPYFTTKQVHKGAGMGLSVVQAIVKTHQGSIFIESLKGKGTTAKVYLPSLEKVLVPVE